MQTTAPPQPDLSVSKSDSSDPAKVGISLTYTITVANNGTEEATGVTLYDILPSSVNFGSATPSQGNCTGTSIIICDLNSLNSGATVIVAVVVTPTKVGRITNAAGVLSDEDDSDLTNNTTVEETRVTPSVSRIYLPLIFK
jgi:uncharacterized repeat protein (TIGR01451 family)